MSREENFSEYGAQKNRLDETVLFSTHNNVWVGRDQTIYALTLRPCHTTTYSTNICRRMKNSASTLVYA